MKKSDYSKPLEKITFHCKACRKTFSAAPAEVIDAPDQEYHPFEYRSQCPDCGAGAGQAWFERNLIKGWQKATGPITADGKAAVTANLAGHPTPEEALRTRFNAMKHGLSARTAQYFPAKPDGYAFCKSCDVDRSWCYEQPCCSQQTQNFMLHHAAFEQRNPKHLQAIHADAQAALMSLIQQMLQTILADGVKIEAPQWFADKEGGRIVVAQYTDENGDIKTIKDISAHPLFKPLGELLSRNNLSLADMGMTVKAIEQEEQEKGFLQVAETTGQSMLEYQNRQVAALENLHGMLERSTARRDKDPILIEYQQQNGGEQ